VAIAIRALVRSDDPGAVLPVATERAILGAGAGRRRFRSTTPEAPLLLAVPSAVAPAPRRAR
jgi:hypothetical protein